MLEMYGRICNLESEQTMRTQWDSWYESLLIPRTTTTDLMRFFAPSTAAFEYCDEEFEPGDEDA